MKKLLLVMFLVTACVWCFSSCGATENISICEHNETITDVAVAPSCINSGLTEGKRCATCGETVVEQETLAALGHNVVVDAAIAPTCTNTGLTAGQHCSVCDEVLVVQNSVSARGHIKGDAVVENYLLVNCKNGGTYDNVVYCTVCSAELSRETIIIEPGKHTAVIDEAVAPGCVDIGYTEGQHCSVCNKVLVYPAAIEPFGHTETISEATEPDCVNPGLSEGTHCSVCGEPIIAQSVVADPLGHTEVIDGSVAPDCVNTGLTEGKHCGTCGDVLVAQMVVAALGHTNSAVVVENRVEPDCTNTGSYDNVTYCTVCDVELSRETVIVNALGHIEVVDTAVTPDCINTGLSEGKHCAVCNEVLVEQTVVAALGHTDSDVVVENSVSPDCTNTGSHDNVVYCTVCDAELSRENVTVDAFGHTEVVDTAVTPDCVNTGLTEGKHCTVCNEVLVAQTVVAALGHTDSDVVVENWAEPDCTHTGSYDNVTYCTVCNVELSRETVIVNALGHIEVVDMTVTPDCINTGLSEGKHCSVCGEVLLAQTIIPATGHTYTSLFVSPTATDDGYTKHTCLNCEDTYNDSYVTPVDFEVTIENRTKVGYTAVTGENLVIPATFEDDGIWYRVTAIGSSAFAWCDNLVGVVLPECVSTIGDYAFYWCTGLASLTMSESITFIGDMAFGNCTSLTGIVIPVTLTSIGKYAFSSCSSLSSIKYYGTLEEWEYIIKNIYWDYNIGNYEITCNYAGE